MIAARMSRVLIVIFPSPSARALQASLISGPFNWCVLQSPFDHFFAQGGRVLFYSRSGREFVFQASVGVDLVSNIVVKAQNAFVVQINNSHELSPIRDYLLLAFSPSSTRRRMASGRVPRRA